MNLENRWVKKAAAILWEVIEEKHADLFPSKTGMPAKPLRMALGSLMIQKQYDISYPQDTNLLNEARENLEALIDSMLRLELLQARTCRENARRDYLNLAKCKKRTAKKIRMAIKKQLQYVRRDFGYMEALLSDGVELSPKQLMRYTVLKQVYEQQQYMYEYQVHTVPNRIVSISQPYMHPIVRGKAAAPVEFGVKLELSIDENDMARLEKLSFDAYNESDVLIGAIERYRERTGHYPERALADKIYRNRENLDPLALPRGATASAGS